MSEIYMDQDYFIESSQLMHRICLEGILLGNHASTLFEMCSSRSNGMISSSFESLVRYTTYNEELIYSSVTDPQYLLMAKEGIVQDIIQGILNFFKRIWNSMKDFVKRAYSFNAQTMRDNKSTLDRLKAKMRKHDNVDGVKVPPVVPPIRVYETLFDNLNNVMEDMAKFDMRTLSMQVDAVLDGKTTSTKFSLTYENILGAKYVDKLSSVGVVFEEESPIFKSVITSDRQSESTIGELGYDIVSLERLTVALNRNLKNLFDQMNRLVTILGNIVNKLTKLRLSKLDDSVKNKYDDIFAEFPKELSKIISLYHKVMSAYTAYDHNFGNTLTLLGKAINETKK